MYNSLKISFQLSLICSYSDVFIPVSETDDSTTPFCLRKITVIFSNIVIKYIYEYQDMLQTLHFLLVLTGPLKLLGKKNVFPQLWELSSRRPPATPGPPGLTTTSPGWVTEIPRGRPWTNWGNSLGSAWTWVGGGSACSF